jgi:hypothetical protein
MKKIFLVLLLICGMQIQAQKTFKVINLTAYPVSLNDIITRTAITYLLPECHSKPNGVATIAPFGTFTLLNTTNLTRFPFYTTPAVISLWERITTTSPGPVIPSLQAWIAGGTQVFYGLNFTYRGSIYNIGATSPYVTFVNGGTFTATYVQMGTLAAPIYTITIQ